VAGDAAGRCRCCGELNEGKPGYPHTRWIGPPVLTILGLAISVCADSSGSDTDIYRDTESVSH